MSWIRPSPTRLVPVRQLGTGFLSAQDVFPVSAVRAGAHVLGLQACWLHPSRAPLHSIQSISWAGNTCLVELHVAEKSKV